jgi:prepilin-type N-terminal cleavage/methylation domain-containing protein
MFGQVQRQPDRARQRRRRVRIGFSLVELLVVIGIIAIVIAFLLPALAGARRQANVVACLSNLRQVGQLLLIYANHNQGWIYPVGVGDPEAPPGPENLRRLGAALPPDQRWPVYVKGLDRWNSPLLHCPLDVDVPDEGPSYALNYWLQAQGMKFGSTAPGGIPASEFAVMGERRQYANTDMGWYFFANTEEYLEGAEPRKHGLSRGSNYLFWDIHVAAVRNPDEVKWGFPTRP